MVDRIFSVNTHDSGSMPNNYNFGLRDFIVKRKLTKINKMSDSEKKFKLQNLYMDVLNGSNHNNDYEAYRNNIENTVAKLKKDKAFSDNDTDSNLMDFMNEVDELRKSYGIGKYFIVLNDPNKNIDFVEKHREYQDKLEKLSDADN